MTRNEYIDYVDAYIRDEQLNEKSSRTINHYKRVITQFLNFFSDQELSKTDFIHYKEHLLETYKPKTVQNYITIINKFIKYCEMKTEEDFDFSRMKMYYSKNTLNNIRLQQDYSLDEVLEEKEFKRLLRKSKELGCIKINLIMKVLGYTGIRIGELKYITVEALKKSNYILVRNKGKNREIIVRQDLRKELLKYAKANKIKEGHIFLSDDGTEPIPDITVYSQMKNIAGKCRGIKLSKIHPHAFRHMFAVQFIDAGGTSTELADVLGHSSVETTRIYTRTTSLMKRKRMESMYRR